jgi:hypothetical protein
MRTSTIHVDPEILGGTPVFRGTRVPIQNLFDYWRAERPSTNFSMISLLFHENRRWKYYNLQKPSLPLQVCK